LVVLGEGKIGGQKKGEVVRSAKKSLKEKGGQMQKKIDVKSPLIVELLHVYTLRVSILLK